MLKINFKKEYSLKDLELKVLLWCKKRVSNRDIEESYSSPAREFLYLFCWKKPSSLSSTGLTTDTQVHEPQAPSWLRLVGQEVQDCDSMTGETEVELLRLQNLSSPPRFLFTIKEETKEDLEYKDKSKRGLRGRSLSDVFSVDTLFFHSTCFTTLLDSTNNP
ncbi:hypothetical protein HanPI659440_Chr05g0205331 [Helianthus annuus]|nr:hypothetical protein HanPI659440_Chr05g0205331 [Helianthus annuus]